MRPVPPSTAPLAVALISFILTGCGLSLSGPRAGTLTASDFRAPDAATAPDRVDATERRAPAYPTEQVDSSRPDFAVIDGAPQITDDGATPPTKGEPVMMDALIGDINGAPLYASSFFTPGISARLAGLAREAKTRQVWATEARKIIATQLGDMVRDEILLAEARASLTPEQKQGLLFFIEEVRRDLVSRGGGGQVAVDQALREQGEKGLEAKLKENIDRQLTYANLRETVLPRATVSWSEVRNEYERRAEAFNPDPRAVLRMIWVTTKNAEQLERFTSDIARGVPFAELAERPENEYKPKEGGLVEQAFKGEYAKAQLFGPVVFNEAARQLRPGGVSPALTFNEWTAWIFLESINTPRPKTIYEAQLEIYNELREKKVKTESDKYLSNLLNKQSYTKISEMGEKLMRIATERYYP